MASPSKVVIGVDVGGTNTDAVLVQLDTTPLKVISSAKLPTTDDITLGVKRAIINAIRASIGTSLIEVTQVNIGTTHLINAIVQRQGLTRVSVIRLCGSASRSVPPFSDFDQQLRSCIEGDVFLVDGGIEFDGKDITTLNEQEILSCVSSSIDKGIRNFVVCGVFSPIKREQENRVRDIILEKHKDISVTVSHEIGQIGLLERENAAILNECLKPLTKRTLDGFRNVFTELELPCPFFLTQNDGTIVSDETALRKPVCTFASGPTNSMRGAAFLSGVQDAIDVDIGGTTTDIGMLMKGFPREASSEVKIGGIRTNFRMPDVLSIGLGGGSYVTQSDSGSARIGPRSAGYNLTNEALVLGKKGEIEGRLLTATDVAVASGLCQIGFVENTEHLDKDLIDQVIDKIHTILENAIDQMKVSAGELPVILVGGGAVLVDAKKPLTGVSNIIVPNHSDVANAVGAALGQVSGTVDYVKSIKKHINKNEMNGKISNCIQNLGDNASDMERETAENNVQKAFFENGRIKVIEKVTIIEKCDTSLHLPGDAVRLQVKAVGNLNANGKSTCVINTSRESLNEKENSPGLQTKQSITATGVRIGDESGIHREYDLPPKIDNNTGEWILSVWDIECISIGAGILGCGGGGSPYLGRLLATMAIQKGKEIRIVTRERLLKTVVEENFQIVPVAIMGAPLILTEKLVSGETMNALQCMQDLYTIGGYENGQLANQENVNIMDENGLSYIKYYNQSVESRESDTPTLGTKRIVALSSVEIGGMNCIEPLLVSAELNIPVIDCDGMGRAFPELQMYIPLVYGSNPFPFTLADDKGRKDVVLKAETAKQLENHFRKVVVEMGGTGGVVFSSLNKQEVIEKMVPNTLSLAWRLGRAVLLARHRCKSPIDAVLEEGHGHLLITGKIQDVRRETTGGFNKGYVVIEGTCEFSEMAAVIEIQNENILVKIGPKIDNAPSHVKACAPDLITIVDNDTGEPIPNENTRYGQRVAVLVLPSHRLLRTPEALAFVGPRAFGYDFDFIPCGPPFEAEPVGPR